LTNANLFYGYGFVRDDNEDQVLLEIKVKSAKQIKKDGKKINPRTITDSRKEVYPSTFDLPVSLCK